MNASIDFLKRATSLGMQSKSLPAWLDEIQSLRDRIAELERENESLKASVYGVYELERQRDELLAVLEDVRKCKSLYSMWRGRNKSRTYGAIIDAAIAAIREQES